MPMLADAEIVSILTSTHVIALVGASANESRPSHRVMRYLQSCGYHVIPINPGLAGQTLLGELVYASLSDVPIAIDMVDVFRNSEAASSVVEEALSLPQKPSTIWMQLGVINAQAAQRAQAAGLAVVMDRCPAIEIPRLSITHQK